MEAPGGFADLDRLSVEIPELLPLGAQLRGIIREWVAKPHASKLDFRASREEHVRLRNGGSIKISGRAITAGCVQPNSRQIYG